MRAVLWALVALALLAGPDPAAAERRLALVIGNEAYRHTSVLKNPRNDATDLAAAFKRLGFEVIEGYDLEKRDMDRLFLDFARRAGEAETALIYYAGHGATFGNVPYLVPVDARFEDEASVPYELSRLDELLAELRRAKGVRIAIIDACRDSDAEQALKRRLQTTRGTSQTRGLSLPADRTGLLIAYSTQPMTVALDGSGGRNSPFAGALLRHVEQPGIDVRLMFTRVKSDVFEQTRRTQLPELSDSLVGEFQLKPGEPTPILAALPPAAPAPAPPAPAAPAPAPAPPDPAAEGWREIERTTDMRAVEAFLARFGSSAFAEPARAKLTLLKAVHARTRLAMAQGFQLAACPQSPGRVLSPAWTWHYPVQTPTVMNGLRELTCRSGKKGLLYARESEAYSFFVADTRWNKSTDFLEDPCAAIRDYCSKP